jgi:hypothetical protein
MALDQSWFLVGEMKAAGKQLGYRLVHVRFASGKLEIRSRQDRQGMVDTTDDNLAQAKLRVARLKEILATYSREG